MASFMRPWLDWLDWLKWDCIGAGIVGRILGLWFRVCVSVIRGLFRFVHGRLRDFVAYISNHSDFETPNRQLSGRVLVPRETRQDYHLDVVHAGSVANNHP